MARRRTDIEWVCCTAPSIPFADEFDLATMTGHAFQELVTDEDVRESVAGLARGAPRTGQPGEHHGRLKGFVKTAPALRAVWYDCRS
jgi:hypothetical protein